MHKVYDEHDAILLAIEGGRRREARKLMSEHIARVGQAFREHRAHRDLSGADDPDL